MSLLKWALIFFLVSIVAGVFGFTGISAATADVAKILFYIFLAICIVLLLLGITIFRAEREREGDGRTAVPAILRLRPSQP
jgi:uncharacterized membrane protein YtjA (UPF0391 family)